VYNGHRMSQMDSNQHMIKMEESAD
jgi:hypothetical protein